MAVVVVQSRATAHVYRIFGALVVLLVAMAVAVTLTRMRGDHQASPYGALGALQAPAATLPASALPAMAVAAAQPAPAPKPPAIGPAPSMDAGPRVIVLDKAAASQATAQPAPQAAVAAATRAAATPAAAVGTPVIATPAVAPPAVAASAPAPVVQPPAAAVTPAPPPAQTAALSPAATPAPAPIPAPADRKPAATGLVNINTASADQLNRVGAGHIGATIVRHRPYRAISDLVSHRVLRASDFARIQSAITVD